MGHLLALSLGCVAILLAILGVFVFFVARRRRRARGDDMFTIDPRLGGLHSSGQSPAEFSAYIEHIDIRDHLLDTNDPNAMS
jgi:hypothetical protein